MIIKNIEECSRRLSTSGFSGNVVVTAETSYQMLVSYLSFCDWDMA